MRRFLLIAISLVCATISIFSQGNNLGMGEQDIDEKSVAERLFNLEKKNERFNVYLNYGASLQYKDGAEGWSSGFANRELRLEILGDITERLSYRLRHRLNSSNVARGGDNFAKATDLMFINYKLNEELSVYGGKVCLSWGGFEYDENPLFIYEYSDFVYWMDIFMAGVGLTYKRSDGHELGFQLANTYNDKFKEEYGEVAVGVSNVSDGAKRLQKSNNPFTFIANWNGNFFGGRLLTRWAWGVQSLAKHKYGKVLSLGQQFTLPSFQWYFDYMGAWEALDHLRIASKDASEYLKAQPLLSSGELGGMATGYLNDVEYHSFITKANWQFAPRWNLMLKAAYERVSATKYEPFKDYRKSFLYATSIEYYPVKEQNLRLFLAYIGHKVNYRERCGLDDYNTNRIELGFMYRLKCY